MAESEVVYSPPSIQLWRTLWNWLAFFYQIFLHLLRVLGHQTLLSSSPSSHSFKPLPVVELQDTTADPPSATSSVEIAADIQLPRADEPIQKLTVVLDLDETLVCAYETSSLPAVVRNQATEAGLKWFELECLSSDKECEGKPKINYVTVFERPGLNEFLKQLSEFADLVLFTAGLEGYARPLVDRIDMELKIQHVSFQFPCLSSSREPGSNIRTALCFCSRTTLVNIKQSGSGQEADLSELNDYKLITIISSCENVLK